jgi:hypothetical protein
MDRCPRTQVLAQDLMLAHADEASSRSSNGAVLTPRRRAGAPTGRHPPDTEGCRPELGGARCQSSSSADGPVRARSRPRFGRCTHARCTYLPNWALRATMMRPCLGAGLHVYRNGSPGAVTPDSDNAARSPSKQRSRNHQLRWLKPHRPRPGFRVKAPERGTPRTDTWRGQSPAVRAWSWLPQSARRPGPGEIRLRGRLNGRHWRAKCPRSAGARQRSAGPGQRR